MVKLTPKKINSLHHPLVKHLVKLRESKDYREEVKSVVVPGRKLVKEISSITLPTHILAIENLSLPGIFPTHLVTSEIIKKITGLSSPEGIVAEFPLPASTDLKDISHLLILDRISDPGNLGTLLRTALAFGWEGVFFLPECVDPFNEKVIRASRGACFSLPFQMGTWEDVCSIAEKKQAPLFLADLEGKSIDEVIPPSQAFLILSNEAQGISSVSASFAKKITIPMKGAMESLNVAVAGGILMYYLKKQKHVPRTL